MRVAYTPMHGVGLETLLAAFARAGFAAPAVVAEQAAPDPDFPTVAFPNPEEPGALDLLLALAADADVAIASDPDADRVAVAVGDRPLRGDETGRAARRPPARRTACAAASPRPSSARRMLARVARGLRRAVHRDAHRLQAPRPRPGSDLVYAYEEALGVAVAPALVRDKDGMSAALLVAEMAARRRPAAARCSTGWPTSRRGTGGTRPASCPTACQDLSLIAAAVDDLRGARPRRTAPFAVVAVEQPADDVLVHRLAGGQERAGRVVVRPSGTEPKLKAYLELVDPRPGRWTRWPRRSTPGSGLASLR